MHMGKWERSVCVPFIESAELDQLADNLEKMDIFDAARTIRDGVADFQKANMRFSLALTQVKEQIKEA